MVTWGCTHHITNLREAPHAVNDSGKSSLKHSSAAADDAGVAHCHTTSLVTEERVERLASKTALLFFCLHVTVPHSVAMPLRAVGCRLLPPTGTPSSCC